ncbi:hypothetical protein AAHE18_06G112700 [Arachis hypogaea]
MVTFRLEKLCPLLICLGLLFPRPVKNIASLNHGNYRQYLITTSKVHTGK